MKKLIVFSIILFLGCMADFARSDDSDMSLLDILRDNETITQQQYEGLKQAMGEKQEAMEEGPVDVEVKTRGGLEIATYDGNFSFEIGGRVMIDSAFYSEDKNKLGDGSELRRARLDIEGNLFADWGYEFSVDFAGGDADVKDAYVSYNGFWPTRIKVGHFKEPFSLEEMTSSRYITFMERALPNEFVPGRSIGVGVDSRWGGLHFAAGLFGEDFDKDVKNEGNEGWAVTGRLTYAPIDTDFRTAHLGVSGSFRKSDSEGEVKFNARPGSHLTDIKYLDTDDIDMVDDLIKYSLEAAGVFGPFSLQGEYLWTQLNRETGIDDARFDGWYIFGSWFITGESRPYKGKKGTFGRIKPKSKYGAVELAVRYDAMDLTDGAIAGGKENNTTFGLNWYFNPNVRLMANYILVNNDDDANADNDVIGDDDSKVFQARFQIDF
jgi:phosphate-selective porin OprO/OprP